MDNRKEMRHEIIFPATLCQFFWVEKGAIDRQRVTGINAPLACCRGAPFRCCVRSGRSQIQVSGVLPVSSLR